MACGGLVMPERAAVNVAVGVHDFHSNLPRSMLPIAANRSYKAEFIRNSLRARPIEFPTAAI